MPSYRDAVPPGFEITRDLRTWETKSRCPRCDCELFAGEKQALTIEACGRCGGVWITSETLARSLAEGSRAPEELAARVERVTRAVPTPDKPSLPCPTCRAAMQAVMQDSTRIDQCSHGTWFDRRELSQVMRAQRNEPTASALETRFLEEQQRRKENPFGPEIDHAKHVLENVLDALFSLGGQEPPRTKKT